MHHQRQALSPSTPTRNGQACTIRPFQAADIPAFFDLCRRPEVSWYMNWPPHKSLADSEQFLSEVIATQHDDIESPWAIVDRKSGVCCGFVGLTHVSSDHRRADMAIALHPDHAGRGIAYEACSLLLQHAKNLGLIRIQAVVELGNDRSVALMERLGGVREALMRQYIVGKRGIVDAYLYAFILQERPEA